MTIICYKDLQASLRDTLKIIFKRNAFYLLRINYMHTKFDNYFAFNETKKKFHVKRSKIMEQRFQDSL